MQLIIITNPAWYTCTGYLGPALRRKPRSRKVDNRGTVFVLYDIMLTDDTRFDSFFAWLQAFDPSMLTNEAEVESKFVVPLFQHLGYPEKCRHPQ